MHTNVQTHFLHLRFLHLKIFSSSCLLQVTWVSFTFQTQTEDQLVTSPVCLLGLQSNISNIDTRNDKFQRNFARMFTFTLHVLRHIEYKNERNFQVAPNKIHSYTNKKCPGAQLLCHEYNVPYYLTLSFDLSIPHIPIQFLSHDTSRDKQHDQLLNKPPYNCLPSQ